MATAIPDPTGQDLDQRLLSGSTRVPSLHRKLQVHAGHSYRCHSTVHPVLTMHPTRSVSLRRTRGQGGSAIFIVMLMLVPICAILGIAADGGWSYYIQQTEHAAAESAAIAAVRSTMDFVYAGASYSCSSSVVCGTQTCPSTNVASVTYNLQSGCDYAIANGFTSGVSIQGSRANPVNGIQ